MTLTFSFTPASAPLPVRLPLSKSMAARALVIRAMAGVAPILALRSICEDTEHLSAAIDAMMKGKKDAWLGASGTGLRLFTALAAATPGVRITADGIGRLRERPLGPLLDILGCMGADIVADRDHAPLLIAGRRLHGGDYRVDCSASSQFISALMLIGPACSQPLRLSYDLENSVSMPYAELTAAMMKRAGADIRHYPGVFAITPGAYDISRLPDAEADWSAASFFYEMAALMPPGSRIEIENLTAPCLSAQPDSFAAGVFARLGVCTITESGSAVLLKEPDVEPGFVELDMGRTPDMVPALAVALCLCGRHFRLRNVAHLRVKECDRLEAVAEGMRTLGYKLLVGADTLGWQGATSTPARHPVISSFGDHRIAMAFAVAAIRFPSITITGAEAVAKSFPDFAAQAARAGLNSSLS